MSLLFIDAFYADQIYLTIQATKTFAISV